MPSSGKRKTHQKVRTGCITCKFRRVKCGEEKPRCLRCTNTGRKCDGYEVQDGDEEQSLDRAIILRSPSKPVTLSELEFRSLEYFQTNTIKSLSGFWYSEPWTTLLLQVSESAPAVRHAMMAISSFHELSDRAEILDRGMPLISQIISTNGSDAFALHHYTKAISLLRQRLGDGHHSRVATLLSCILFICLEFVRGNNDAALAHLSSGVKILRSQTPRKQLQAGSAESTSDEVLAPMFTRLSLIQSLHGQQRAVRYLDILDVEIEPPVSSYENLSQARAELMNVTSHVFQFLYMINNDEFSNAIDAQTSHLGVQAHVQQWLETFEEFLDNSRSMSGSETSMSDDNAAILLKLEHKICSLWVEKAIHKDELAWDEFIPVFGEIVTGITALLDDWTADQTCASSTNAFSFDTNLISMMYFTAMKCRDKDIRRNAVTQLARCPRREGLWDSQEALKVVSCVIEAEEEALDGPHDKSLPPEWGRIHDVDVHKRDSIDPGIQTCILLYKPNGLDNDWIKRREFLRW